MDKIYNRGGTTDIIILSADTYLTEGLVNLAQEILSSNVSRTLGHSPGLTRLSLNELMPPGAEPGEILLMDERIFTDPTFCRTSLSDQLARCCRAIMLTRGGQHYCGSQHLNTLLPTDLLGQHLYRLLSDRETRRLSLSDILSPLNMGQKVLLGLLSSGCTVEQASVRMQCSKKTVYHLRKQTSRRMGMNTLCEMQRFMSFYRFMIWHDSRQVVAGQLPVVMPKHTVSQGTA